VATRIVSLSPSTTETLFVIGAGDKVVGRSRYCDWPPEVLKLPQIGGYVDPSYEAILARRPDLVTGARGPAGAAMSERLDARGIMTFLPQTESFAQIDAMILGLGERTGHTKEAKTTVDALDARVVAIEKAVATRPRVRVLLVFGLEPLSVAGPSSFAEEMIRRAGGTNAVTEGGGYPTIGVEHVMTLDPDVVVNAAIAEAHGKERLNKDTPGWARVRAVVQGRVVPITDESVLRPGPRIGDGLAALARAIHPDVAIP
jgi:iron complex transport system substrate-binding protein